MNDRYLSNGQIRILEAKYFQKYFTCVFIVSGVDSVLYFYEFLWVEGAGSNLQFLFKIKLGIKNRLVS